MWLQNYFLVLLVTLPILIESIPQNRPFNGGFQHTQFLQRVSTPVCNDLLHCGSGSFCDGGNCVTCQRARCGIGSICRVNQARNGIECACPANTQGDGLSQCVPVTAVNVGNRQSDLDGSVPQNGTQGGALASGDQGASQDGVIGGGNHVGVNQIANGVGSNEGGNQGINQGGADQGSNQSGTIQGSQQGVTAQGAIKDVTTLRTTQSDTSQGNIQGGGMSDTPKANDVGSNEGGNQGLNQGGADQGSNQRGTIQGSQQGITAQGAIKDVTTLRTTQSDTSQGNIQGGGMSDMPKGTADVGFPEENSGQVNRNPGCLQTPSPGECRAAFKRYYYNSATDQCDCFLFGGCDEEEEAKYSWVTLEECQRICLPGNKAKGPGCKRASLEEVTAFLEEQRRIRENNSN